MDLVVCLLLGLDRPITSPQVVSFHYPIIAIIVDNSNGKKAFCDCPSGGDVNGLLLG